jgi:predicted permease
MLIKIAEITLPIFLIVLVGFFYSRAVKPDLSGANKLTVDIALPALVFTSLSAKDFNTDTAMSFALAAMMLMALSGVMAFAMHRWTGASWRALLPCIMFVNVGPIGIPLMVLAYGPAGLAPAIVLFVLSNILHFTLGAGIMSGRVDWRTVFANPLVWASVLGIAFSKLQWTLPVWLGTPLTMIGNVLVPMMLLSLGARLSTSRISDAKVGLAASLLMVACRLAAAYLLLMVLPLQGVERGAFILFACLPPAVFNFLLADKFQLEPNKVASIVSVGHLASLAFLPLGIWLAFHV